MKLIQFTRYDLNKMGAGQSIHLNVENINTVIRDEDNRYTVVEMVGGESIRLMETPYQISLVGPINT